MKTITLVLFLFTYAFLTAQDYRIELTLKECTIQAYDITGAAEEVDLSEVKGEGGIEIRFDKKFKSIKATLEDRSKKAYTFTELGLNPNAPDKLLVTGQRKLKNQINDTLAYPYQFIITKDNGVTCPLEIGSQGQGLDTDDASPPLKVLEGVSWYNTDTTDIDSIIDANSLQRKNAVLLIDCSPLLQSTSVLYRRGVRKKSKPKKVDLLHLGDYLKIYFYNFNKYRYKIEINDVQEDFSVGKPESILGNTITQELGEEGADAASTGGADPDKELRKYALAVDSLNMFIESVKNQSTPSSILLEENKKIILNNLSNSELSENVDFLKLYDRAGDEKLEETYKKAASFPLKVIELKSLSYTLESTVLPIQIKSFDQIKLDVTIKDNDNNVIGTPREYIYKIFGGIKVDQSFGLLGHQLKDEEYVLKSTMFQDTVIARNPNGTIIQVIKEDGILVDSILQINNITKKEIIDGESENSSKVTLGISTLTHFYYRMGAFNLGPQIGVSADLYPEQNLRYLVGGSIMFTWGRHRVSLNSGYAFGKVNVLSPTNSVGDFLEGDDAQLPLIESNRKSMYFGISYNIPITNNETQLPNIN